MKTLTKRFLRGIGTHDTGRTDPGMGKRAGESVDVLGSDRNGTEAMQSANSLPIYIDMSWRAAMQRIRKDGLLVGHNLR